MQSLPFLLCSLLLGMAAGTPTPSLSTPSTPTRAQPRAATTTASSSDAWWSSQSKFIQFLIVLAAIIGVVAFGWIIGKTCTGWDRVHKKYFAVPTGVPPPTQAELNQCWQTYGAKDGMGNPRPAALVELKTCWEAHGRKIREYNRPTAYSSNDGGGGDSGGGGGDGGGGGGGGDGGGGGGDGGG